MFASSSRTVLGLCRNATVKTPTAASFSTSSPSLARRELTVELLQDIPGLGLMYANSADDKVKVAPGRARNQLVPSRQARYIPWKRKSDIMIMRPRPERIEQSISSTTAPVSPTSPELLTALYSLPPSLKFSLRTITPTSTQLFGSLTLGDIQDRLAKEHNLASTDVQVVWRDSKLISGSRLKELGEWPATVKVRGGNEQVELAINVERLEG